MTEQRLIDANILSTSFGTLDWHCDNDCQYCAMHYGACEAELRMSQVQCIINSAPAIDAVPVVRCRDCKYWMYNNRCDNALVNSFDPNFFCGFFERKDVGHDGND